MPYIDQKLRPIAVQSGKFATPAEKDWSIVEKESLEYTPAFLSYCGQDPLSRCSKLAAMNYYRTI